MGKSTYKWPFSIATLNYQRVSPEKRGKKSENCEPFLGIQLQTLAPPDQTRLNLHLVTSSFFLVVFPYFWTNKPHESSINKHHVGWSKYHEVIQQIPIRWQELLLDWQIVVPVQVFDFLTLNLRTTKTRRWTTRPRWKKDFSGCLKTWCIYIYVCVYQW